MATRILLSGNKKSAGARHAQARLSEDYPVPLASFGTNRGGKGGILALRRRFGGSGELESLERHTGDCAF